MDTQHRHMAHLHDTFWRNDHITVVFRSRFSLVSSEETFSNAPLRELDLPLQLQHLNAYLEKQQIPIKLDFLDGSEPKPETQQMTMNKALGKNTSPFPPGVYAFSFSEPIQSDYGLVSTGIVSFLKLTTTSSGGSGAARPTSTSSSGSEGDHEHKGATTGLIPALVQQFNEHLAELNGDEWHIPITIAAPAWLTGGTPVGGGQGCPLTPPIPVKQASCSYWHLELPGLSSDLQAATGDGVTVFILDSFPERGEIARATRDAGDDNLLLRNVNETVSFDYSSMSGVQDIEEMLATNAAVGKDVYGRHYAIKLADHGLFIAGIVRDIAPDARIECIRVLDDLCLGEVDGIANALWGIYARKAFQTGDLYGKPVVVNLSLVTPTNEEVMDSGIDTSIGQFNNVWSSLKYPIKSLTDLGVIFVASAGNEGDLRDNPGGMRPNALYPAAFGNPPDSIDGVIPVGAINAHEHATSYSCYPGPRGIATWGGEVPTVTPKKPTSSDPKVDISDMMRGIYSSVEYPPLSSDPPEQYSAAPNDSAWAYWVGTSFATPIISGIVARVLQARASSGGSVAESVHDKILSAATAPTTWDRLGSTASGAMSDSADGRAYKAVQTCVARDRDHEDEVQVEIEVTEINVIVDG